MADITQQATVNIEVNSESAKRRIAELENKLDDLNKKKKEFEKSGDTSGLVKTEKELQKVGRQLNNARTNAQKCEAALKKLNSASPKELRMTLKQLQNDLNYIERGSKAWHAHIQTIKRVKAEIKAVDNELVEHQTLLQRANGFVNKWGMSIASVAASFTGLVFTARQAVEAYADMDAEMANVRKFTGMTAEEVDALNEEFKKMDTRTSREELNKLAQEAGRLGLQTQEDVLGFVKAADVINIALDDLGEGATLTISKLTDIFGAKEMYGVEQSMLKVGSVINELSQSCTASAPYLADFAQRLAGTGAAAELSLQEIMAYGAVLDSTGQQVEMSASAVSQVIMKLFKDPAKVAKATGMDVKEFTETLKTSTNDALLMLLDRLKELGSDQGLLALAPIFASMKMDGVRVSGVLNALANNVDMVKDKQKLANQAFKDGTSVIKEYNVQNNTVKANLDKAKKGFHEMAVELGQKLAPAMKHVITGTSAMMRAMMTTASFISNHIATIVALTGVIVTLTIAYNAETIALKALIFWQDKFIPGVKNLWKLIAEHPYAALAAAMAVVIGYIIDMTRKTDEMALAVQTMNDIRDQAKKKLAEETQEVQTLMSAAGNLNLTYDEQLGAVSRLNKIIPGFNGKIDAQTRAFTYSEKALRDYNDQLVRLYELEGAKEKLTELGRKRVDLVLQQKKIEKQIEDERKFQRERSDNILAYGNPNDPNPSATQATGDAIRMGQLQRALNSVNSEIASIDNTVKAINDEYGTDMQRQAVKQPQTPTIIITTDGSGFTPPDPKKEKERAAAAKKASAEEKKRQREAEAAEKKRKAEEEKKKRLAAAMEKKEFKDAFDTLKKQRDQSHADALKSYREGKLDYEGYLKKLHEASTEFYENSDKLFEKHGVEESDEVAKLHKKREEEELKHQETLKELQQDALADKRDKDAIQAEMDFYDPLNKAAYKNEEYRDARLAKIGLEYHQKMLKLETAGTKEYYEAERALDKAVKEEELRQRILLEQRLQEWLTTYNLLGAKERKAMELKVAEEMYKDKADKEEEYQQVRAAIIKKYRDLVNEETGTTAQGQGFSDAAADRDKALAALEKAKKEGLLEGEEDYQHRRWEIIKNYHDQIKGLVSSEGSDWATMVTNLVESFKNAFDNIGANLADILKSVEDMAAATFAILGAGLESWSNYSNAQRDLEVANVTKSYDEKIKAAGNNDKKTKKLEEQKQKEIAKIKSKYNKRAQAIEMAQAVSSTAMAAINAYASAAQVPMIGYIIAPIAASLALAAGALQIATIKKQHQAEAAGYYEGGFTSRDANDRREVGVVHANEFVANHDAVSNPQLVPVLRLIDYAQRNNTVGSLTSEDVSRAIGQGSILGEMTATQQRSLTEREASMAVVAAAMEQQSLAIAELNRRLAEGIESYMVMDGERGFEKYWDNYQALKARPQR